MDALAPEQAPAARSSSAAFWRGLWSWLRYRPAWLAGADPQLLREVEGDKPFHDRLGCLVVVITALNGVAMTYLASTTLGMPMARLWFVGAIWWVVLLNLEPLLLDVAGEEGWRHTWAPIAMRVSVSLVIATLFAEAFLTLVFNGSIQNELGSHHVTMIQHAQTNAVKFYGGKIKIAEGQIATLQAREQRLANRIATFDRLAGCERNEPSCSHTHEPTCGNWCHYYQRVANDAKAQLARIQPAYKARIDGLNSQIAGWLAAEKSVPKQRAQEINGASDLIDREQALWAIETRSGVAAVWIWSVRFALLMLDLMPLGLKLSHRRTSSYRAYATAARGHQAVAAYQVEQETLVARERVRLNAEMEMEVDRARIAGETARRVGVEEAKWEEWSRTDSRPRGEPLRAELVSEYAARSVPHGSLPVDVPRGLRRAGWIGTGSLVGLASFFGLYSMRTGLIARGEWIVLASAIAAVALAGLTRGFRRAPAWALWATFGTLVTGLVMPVVLLVVNL